MIVWESPLKKWSTVYTEVYVVNVAFNRQWCKKLRLFYLSVWFKGNTCEVQPKCI